MNALLILNQAALAIIEMGLEFSVKVYMTEINVLHSCIKFDFDINDYHIWCTVFTVFYCFVCYIYLTILS